MKSRQVQVRDSFRALPEYCVDPLTIVAIGLKIGEAKFDKCVALAKDRGLREFAIVGDVALHVALRPDPESWPPEPWMHEFVKPKYLAQARSLVTDA